MKKNEVVVGGTYLAKVSGKVVPVRITGESRFGGWDAVNTDTNQPVRIKSAQRLRRPADAATKQAVASDNPLVRLDNDEFTEALNKATVEQLRDVLEVRTLPARKRSRIAAALKTRTMAALPAKADDVAKAVEAVTKGDLTKGVKVSTASKKKAGPSVTTSKADAVDAAMKAVAADKAKRASGLDAAARVLAENGKPMSTGEMVEQMLAKGYWTTGGKTPAATIYSAILREINVKGADSRFRKTDRGHFELAQVSSRS